MLLYLDREQGEGHLADFVHLFENRRMLVIWTDHVPVAGSGPVQINMQITTFMPKMPTYADMIRSHMQIPLMKPGVIEFGGNGSFPPSEVETVRRNGAIAARVARGGNVPEKMIFGIRDIGLDDVGMLDVKVQRTPRQARGLIYAIVPGTRADFPEWGNVDARAQLNHHLTKL